MAEVSYLVSTKKEEKDEKEEKYRDNNVVNILRNKMILSYPHGIYQKIFYTTLFLHPIHISSAFYYNNPHCGWMGILLYMTSLNFWRYPEMNSYSKMIDCIVARGSIGYHVYLSFYTSNKSITTLPMLAGISFYVVSTHLYLTNKRYAAYCHCLLHILVSMGAIFTYRDYYLQMEH